MFSGSQEFRVKLLIGCLSFVISLGIGEVLARLFLPVPQFVYVRESSGHREEQEDKRTGPSRVSATGRHKDFGRLFIETDSGRRLRPNTRVRIENNALSGRHIEFSINSIGYRNPEIVRKDKPRILFLGDSITMCTYLPESETFVRLVESLSEGKGRGWETINAGVDGIALADELAILTETGLDLRPDIVVVGFYLNDYQASPGIYVPVTESSFEKSRLYYYIKSAIERYSAFNRSTADSSWHDYPKRISWQREYAIDLMMMGQDTSQIPPAKPEA